MSEVGRPVGKHEVLATVERLFIEARDEEFFAYLDHIPQAVWKSLDRDDRAYLARAVHIAAMQLPVVRRRRA